MSDRKIIEWCVMWTVVLVTVVFPIINRFPKRLHPIISDGKGLFKNEPRTTRLVKKADSEPWLWDKGIQICEVIPRWRLRERKSNPGLGWLKMLIALLIYVEDWMTLIWIFNNFVFKRGKLLLWIKFTSCKIAFQHIFITINLIGSVHPWPWKILLLILCFEFRQLFRVRYRGWSKARE